MTEPHGIASQGAQAGRRTCCWAAGASGHTPAGAARQWAMASTSSCSTARSAAASAACARPVSMPTGRGRPCRTAASHRLCMAVAAASRSAGCCRAAPARPSSPCRSSCTHMRTPFQHVTCVPVLRVPKSTNVQKCAKWAWHQSSSTSDVHGVRAGNEMMPGLCPACKAEMRRVRLKSARQT